MITSWASGPTSRNKEAYLYNEKKSILYNKIPSYTQNYKLIDTNMEINMENIIALYNGTDNYVINFEFHRDWRQSKSVCLLTDFPIEGKTFRKPIDFALICMQKTFIESNF